jgi:hypothetical protein
MTRYQQMLFSISLLLSTFLADAAEIALKPEQIRNALHLSGAALRFTG